MYGLHSNTEVALSLPNITQKDAIEVAQVDPALPSGVEITNAESVHHGNLYTHCVIKNYNSIPDGISTASTDFGKRKFSDETIESKRKLKQSHRISALARETWMEDGNDSLVETNAVKLQEDLFGVIIKNENIIEEEEILKSIIGKQTASVIPNSKFDGNEEKFLTKISIEDQPDKLAYDWSKEDQHTMTKLELVSLVFAVAFVVVIGVCCCVRTAEM